MSGPIVWNADAAAPILAPTSGEIVFRLGSGLEAMRFAANGDIYVRGVLTTNDLEVVDGMRDLLAKASVVP